MNLFKNKETKKMDAPILHIGPKFDKESMSAIGDAIIKIMGSLPDQSTIHEGLWAFRDIVQKQANAPINVSNSSIGCNYSGGHVPPGVK